VSSRAPRTCPELGVAVTKPDNTTDLSYGHYVMLRNYTGSFSNPNWEAGLQGPGRIVDLQRPAKSMAIADAAHNPVTGKILSYHQSIFGGTGVHGWPKRWAIGMNGTGGNLPYDAVMTQGHRHNRDQVNFVFFDGHGETRKYSGPTESYGGFGVLLSRNRHTYANWDQ